MPNTDRNNRSRSAGAVNLLVFAFAPILILIVLATSLVVTLPQPSNQVIESDRLSPKSYEIQTILNREISTAIGHSMSVFFESHSPKPRKSYARQCACELRAKLFDIRLITDKELDKAASSGASRSWQELRRLVDSASDSCKALNDELSRRKPNWTKVTELSRAAADTLMETDDPHRAVIDNH